MRWFQKCEEWTYTYPVRATEEEVGDEPDHFVVLAAVFIDGRAVV